MRIVKILAGDLFKEDLFKEGIFQDEPFSVRSGLLSIFSAQADPKLELDIRECENGCEDLVPFLNEFQPDIVFLTARQPPDLSPEAVRRRYREVLGSIPDSGIALVLPPLLISTAESLSALGVDLILSLDIFLAMADEPEKYPEECLELKSDLLGISRSAADYLVECLQRQRVRFVFGVPGSEILPVIRGLQKDHISHGIRFILTTGEQGAAFMADTIGRLSPGRVPGVCISTLGPGATNLITGVANAWEDKSPLVVINGQAPSSRSGKESHQIENTLEMFAPFVIYRKAIQSGSAEEISSAVANAFRRSRMERPRPSVLEIPVDIQRRRCDGPFSVPIIKPYEYPDPRTSDPLRLPQGSRAVIEDAARALMEANRPVIIVGPGAARAAENQGELQTSQVLTRMAVELKIPVTHTFMGKGVVDEEVCPWVIPVAGVTQNDTDYDLFNLMFDTSDLIITVGYDFHEFDCRIWNRFRGSEENQARIINISYVPPQVEAFYLPRHVLTGSIAYNLEALKEAVDSLPAGEKGLRWHKNGWLSIPPVLRKLLGEEQERITDSRGMRMIQSIVSDLKYLDKKLLSEENRKTLLITDTGLHKMWLSRYYPPSRPESFLVPNGFSPMGYAVPAAVGASFLFHEDRLFKRETVPGRPPLVVAVMGDGCFRMSGFELITAVQNELPVIFLLIRDNNLGMIEAKEKSVYGSITTRALALPQTDYETIARGMGAKALTATTENLRDCLIKASREEKHPTFIVLDVEQRKVSFSCILRKFPLKKRKEIRKTLIEMVDGPAPEAKIQEFVGSVFRKD